MKKKLKIPKDFWKDFKDRKDFDDFFNELFKEGINQMLKAEMTNHLGYEKHSNEGDNSRQLPAMVTTKKHLKRT